ncbi:MAG: DUF3410 domain-containing protein, partial [Ignavibacteriaceae bacterium]|nr:DUF3410 domain-containing protein [Ignavibacteriaceae bacterium]
KPDWIPKFPAIDKPELTLSAGTSDEIILYKLFNSIYDIEEDDRRLREILNYKADQQPAFFDRLRKTYPMRREFTNYTILLSEQYKYLIPFLESIHFKIKLI